MKKKYLVEFKYLNGETTTVEFETDDLQWSIDQYMRNRPVAGHKVINEDSVNSKRMLLG